ncbi:hypothetical protein NM688_g7953 [Phlebia brevispora]|uniref:Uncharacterized protein n=1 Tax=Phlebia brevispora TaxID=194682 RepID=A0ACC1RZ80_9APHY|nr:hypothetical protein NM688_g7953 [Phlebia brevispora]
MASCRGVIGTVSSVAGELVVQIVTWMKTAEVKRILTRLKIRQPLTKLLLRDGTTGFTFLAVFSIVMQAIPTSQDLSILSLPFVSILMCRFMMKLRQVHLSDGTSGKVTSYSISIPSIVIGNLGAPLGVSGTTESEDYETGLDDDNLIFISSDPLGSGLRLA